MNFATWSIRNPIPVILLFALLSLAGVWGFNKLGIQDFPDIDLPGINVSLRLPGAAPAQLESEVARKVEDKLAALRGLRYINTTITDGTVSIGLLFQIGTSLSDALLDTKDAVDSVRNDLPTDLEQPQVSKVTTGPGGPTLTYAVTHAGMTEEELSWFTDNTIARSAMAVTGVGKFTRVGGVQREIQIFLSPTQLNAIGASVADVSRAVRRMQQDNSGGRGQLGGSEQGIRTLAENKTAQELKELPIILNNGKSVRLDQIASIRDTIAERSQAALLDGKPAVGFQLQRGRGQDEIELEEGFKKKIIALEASNPGLKFIQVSGTVEHTREQYKGSMQMLLEGGLLAIIVIWIYLRDWRATLIGAVALPLSILPTFAYMAWAGYALNTITLLALAVVVGVLVDDAIVEVENVERHLAMGKSVREATEDAVNEIWMAVLATTATLVVVFLPTAFMSGIPGLVFKQFGWTVVISVLASLVVARLATPAMAVWLLKKPAELKKSDTNRREGPVMTMYLRLVTWCLRHRAITFVIASALFIGSVALIPFLPKGFIPAADRGTSTIEIELPPGTPLSQTVATAEQARLAISQVDGVRQVFVTAGAMQGRQMGSAGTAEVRKAALSVMLQERGKRPKQQDIENALRPLLKQVPGMNWSISGGGPGEKLQLVLASQDSAALKASAQAIQAQLRALPFLSGVTSSDNLERPEIIVRPDLQRAAERGVTTATIGETLRVATSGDFSGALAKLNLDQRQLDVVVRLPDEVRQDIEAIANLRVPGKNGLVPLGAVADISIESGPSQISRLDRSRNVTITADLGGYPLSDALQAAKALAAVKALPPSVELKESGDAEVMRDLFSGFGIALLIAVLCKYCVLVLLYKDWLQPFTNLSTLPLSVGGAFAALLVAGADLSLPTLIGIVMLFGVVTKNSILVVDYAFMAMRDFGMNERDALLDACRKRARPVMMTTVAMVAGMLPLALGFGGDSSFRRPMAIAVIGGLMASTLLSLVLVPVISTYMNSLQRSVVRLFGRKGQQSQVVDQTEFLNRSIR